MLDEFSNAAGVVELVVIGWFHAFVVQLNCKALVEEGELAKAIG